MTLGRRHTLGLAIALALIASRRPAPVRGAQPTVHWQAGDAPPDVEGIRLGDPRERVEAVLGAPDPDPLPDDPTADLSTLSFRSSALLIAISRTEGVSRIMLRRPEGGALAGIRVGDPLVALLIHWGEPTQSHGSLGRYIIGTWTISVRADLGEQKVLRLMLARTPTQPTNPPPADTGPPPAASPTP